MKTVLVTGGAGFIGSHLIDRLLKEGNRVICIDSLSTGSRENLIQHQKNKQLTFIKHDIVEPFSSKEKIDQIYNLACPDITKAYQELGWEPRITMSEGLQKTIDFFKRSV